MWLKETIHVCSTVVDKCEKESINACKNKLFEYDNDKILCVVLLAKIAFIGEVSKFVTVP